LYLLYIYHGIWIFIYFHDQVKQYEIDKLEGAVQQLQHDLTKQKNFFEKNYIPEESLEEFKQALETKVSVDILLLESTGKLVQLMVEHFMFLVWNIRVFVYFLTVYFLTVV